MSIPKEPRQLMINLMYLVLTALLALNVSAEIINAFFLIDKGIAGSNAVIDESNDFAVTVLGKNAAQEPEKYQPLVDAAAEVQRISSEFTKYIDETREGLIDATGQGYFPEDDKKHPGQPKAYKNKDVTTRILVNDGKGAEMRERILGDREKILGLIRGLSGMEGTNITDTTIADLEKSITLNISNEWENSKKKSWEEFTFNHMPVASIFPIFRKFQNDMKSSEAAVLNFLVNQVGAQAFKVDAFIPISSATKSYVIAGEPYESKITIGASSKSVYDNMIVKVDGKTLDVEDGVADYSVSTSSTGVKKYKVDITLTNPTTGKTETYSQDFEYEVGRRSVTVAADKMNVFYIGVDNPVSVVAAGVSSNDLRVSGSGAGLKLKGRGSKYTATVSTPGEAKVNVSGGGLKATSFTFRAKRIPDPVAKLGKTSGGPIGNGEFKAQGGVLAILDGFDFDARCNIQGFNLTYVAKRQDPVPVINKGPAYSAQAKRLVQRAKPGDIYYFDNVRARCPGDKAGRKINAMVFTIK